MSLLQISEPVSLKNKKHRELSLGIDLGTTNSVVACILEGKPQTIGDVYPSVFNGIKSIKRLMGTNEKIIYQNIEYSPVEISAHFLKDLKNQAEKIVGVKFEKAVITVPAHFDDAARNDTKLAAKIAGLEVLRLINEPTAAALAYGLDQKAEGIYLIYDFGGGTFDVSVLRMEKGVFQVLATGGDTFLGGDDIDLAILKYLGLNESEYSLAREAKEYLSNNDIWSKNGNVLTKEQFNQIAKPFIERTINICVTTIKESNVEKINDIILVGGSTRTPLVKEMIEQFWQKPLDNIDPDIVVALGAAITADSLTNGSDNLLLDVNSLSIGLEVMGGMNERIIPKNSPIPCSVSKQFTTYQDGQTGMIFHIVQGEREMAGDCRSLARFELKGIPPMRAGVAKVAVNFSIDADGLLTISAIEETSGIKQIIEMKPSYGVSQEEVEKMIEQSYVYAEQDFLAKNLAQARLKAEENIKNIILGLEEDENLISHEKKNEILSVIKELEQISSRDDYKKIEIANEKLEACSYEFIHARLNRQIRDILKGKSTKEFKS